MSSAQLPLDFSHRPAIGVDDFVVTSVHLDAYNHLLRWAEWSLPVSLLVGSKGSGKTHLARIFAHQTQAVWLQQDHMNKDISDGRAVILELDMNKKIDEEVLFHTLNRWIHGANKSVLITAESLPSNWGLGLPDLVSRLRLLPIVQIDLPDDQALRQILVKQIQDRQLMIDPDVIDYILERMERTFAAAIKTIKKLDDVGLAKQRRITKLLARDVLYQSD